MKIHKYTHEDVVNQIRYMCKLWQNGAFDDCSRNTVFQDMEMFVHGIIDTCDAVGKTDKYISKIMNKDLHVNS